MTQLSGCFFLVQFLRSEDSADEVHALPFLFFRQAVFRFAECDALHEERHVAHERAHGLEAFMKSAPFAWGTSVFGFMIPRADE